MYESFFKEFFTMEVYANLILGDCREKLDEIEDSSVDLIFTSPPYADRRKNTYGGIHPDKYVDWFSPISKELLRILKPTGTFILNIKEKAINGERHTYVIELILEMKKNGWLWTEEFIWHKKNCYPGKWPNRFRDAWERLLQFNKKRKFNMYQDKVKVPVGDWADDRLKNLSNKDKKRVKSEVEIYHYGWVRPPHLMQNKKRELSVIHRGQKKAEEEYGKLSNEFDYGPLDRLAEFQGTHPKVMQDKIAEMDWKDKLQYSGKPDPRRQLHRHEKLSNRIITWIEQKLLGGYYLGGTGNYKLLNG